MTIRDFWVIEEGSWNLKYIKGLQDYFVFDDKIFTNEEWKEFIDKVFSMPPGKFIQIKRT